MTTSPPSSPSGLRFSPVETLENVVTTAKATAPARTPSQAPQVKTLSAHNVPAKPKKGRAAIVDVNPPRSQLAATLALASVSERIALEVRGVPVRLAQELFTCLQISTAEAHQLVGMARAPLRRRLATPDGIIDGMPGQTVVGYADLLNCLDRLLAEFGGQDGAAPSHFHAGKWLGQWLREPHPALGGVPPATYMQAPSGRTAVTRILGGAFSGAYQ